MAPPSLLPEFRELARRQAQVLAVVDQKIVDDFVAEVEIAYRIMSARFYRKDAPKRFVSRVSRGRAVAAACDILRMDPPRPGKPINLRKARTQKRLLARVYHPDSGSGEGDRLNEVLEAYETLDHYSKMETK